MWVKYNFRQMFPFKGLVFSLFKFLEKSNKYNRNMKQFILKGFLIEYLWAVIATIILIFSIDLATEEIVLYYNEIYLA